MSVNPEFVDIHGVDKVALLHMLWKGGVTKPWYVKTLPAFDFKGAAVAVTASHIDYFGGCAIKCCLSGDTAEPDRDAGGTAGKFQQIVNALKKGK
jgi:hypothetical protein